MTRSFFGEWECDLRYALSGVLREERDRRRADGLNLGALRVANDDALIRLARELEDLPPDDDRLGTLHGVTRWISKPGASFTALVGSIGLDAEPLSVDDFLTEVTVACEDDWVQADQEDRDRGWRLDSQMAVLMAQSDNPRVALHGIDTLRQWVAEREARIVAGEQARLEQTSRRLAP